MASTIFFERENSHKIEYETESLVERNEFSEFKHKFVTIFRYNREGNINAYNCILPIKRLRNQLTRNLSNVIIVKNIRRLKC